MSEDDQYPIAPEGSSLSHSSSPTAQDLYEVQIVTLDSFCGKQKLFGIPSVVKIDVEGFETQVLLGAQRYIAATKPFLSIDIHPDPFGSETTELGVRNAPSSFGYSFEKVGHVLLSSP